MLHVQVLDWKYYCVLSLDEVWSYKGYKYRNVHSKFLM